MELAVLLSIQPQWCEKIASGEKTVEVRKTAPKIGIPFMCYMYCTSIKNSPADWLYRLPNQHELYLGAASRDYDFIKEEGDFLNRKVIGEFVCDRVDKYDYTVIACVKFEVNGGEVEERKRYNAGACLSAEEMFEYSGGKTLYGWHISDLKIYDKPKELEEFVSCNGGSIKRPFQSWGYVCLSK